MIDFEKDVEEWEETELDYDDETTQHPNPSIDHLSKSLSDLQISEKRCDANSNDEILVNQTYVTQVNHEILNANEKELQSWRSEKVFDEIENNGQPTISVHWVLKQKLVDGKCSTKARLCARGFKEVESFKTESPTCSRESVPVASTFKVSNKKNLNAINIKTAFLQGKKIDRTIIIKPPKEVQTNKLWKLNKCVYGSADALRWWDLRLKEELLKLNVTVSKYNPGIFYYTKDKKLQGLMVCFVDDILWGSTDEFKADLIDRLGQIFTIGSKFSQAFTYLGIEIHHNNNKFITINQNNYAKAIQPILLTTNQLTEKDVKIPQEVISAVRSLVGQLNWLSSISRPDISFDTCKISTKVNNMKIRDAIELHKVVKSVKNEKNQILFLSLDPNAIKLVVYTDGSFKGCVCYIFASLFCMSKREHLRNKENCFLFHFENSFRYLGSKHSLVMKFGQFM